MDFLKPEKRYNIELQSPSKSIWSTFKKAFLAKKDFKSFWKKLDKKNLPPELVKQTETFVNSPSYKHVSKFWRHCSINSFKVLSESSAKEKQNSIILDDYASNTFFTERNFREINLKNLENIKLDINIFKKHNNLDYYQSMSYNLVTSIYFLQLKKQIEKFYNKINKNFYDTFSHNIKIDNIEVNQHLMYSIVELEKINRILDNKNENLNILEFGAGYGRTANLFFSLMKKIKYVIVDIPPSFYVSTLQFKKYYPNLKILHAFQVNDFNEMQKAIEENDIIYIFPHQLKYLKENFFDLSIMLGVTLEMEPNDVKHYMVYVDKLCKNLYMKVFKYSGLPFSFYKVFRYNVKEDYFIPDNWKELFLDLGIETDFFCHYGYKIK